MTAALKTSPGNFFEDFRIGQVIEHATPRTITAGDAALYIALTGSRFALNSSEPFAHSLGFPEAPIDDWLLFHLVFGKTVPDVSLNAVANLGYAAGRFLAPAYVGDTVSEPAGRDRAGLCPLGHGPQTRPGETGAGAPAAGPARGGPGGGAGRAGRAGAGCL